LRRFGKVPGYVVTDGNARVQENKIKALGIERYVKKAMASHRYGRASAKPSPVLFQKIARWEGVPPGRVVYVGDNPNKDFVGIKPLGFRTVRVLQGMFRNVRLDERHEADLTIPSLDDLTMDRLRDLVDPIEEHSTDA
jgi:putative hydrolase of the HAD superfamily